MVHNIKVWLIVLRIVPFWSALSIVDDSSRTLHVELFRREIISLWLIALHFCLASLRLWRRPHSKRVCSLHTFVFTVTLVIYRFHAGLEHFAVVAVTTFFSALSRSRLEFLGIGLSDTRRSWNMIELTLVRIILEAILSACTILVRAIPDTVGFLTTSGITLVFYCACFRHPFSRITHTFFQKV